MILQALADHYERLAEQGKVESPGWCKAKVSYGLELDEAGRLIGVIPLKREEVSGKKTVLVAQEMKVPEMVDRRSNVLASFLCDNSGYLLGIDRKGKPERAIQCFQAAKEKHLQILGQCGSEAAKAVTAFFETWDPTAAETYDCLQEDKEDILINSNLVFFYKGKCVQEDAEIQQAWGNYYSNGEATEVNTGICLITGERGEIARIHAPIKGVPGAKSDKAALVSFNAPSFESYGKKQSFNAPISTKAMYAYTTALNHLIADRTHRNILGDTMIVYWAESGEQEYQDIFASMMDPQEDTQEILQGVFRNLERRDVVNIEAVEKCSMEERFYILGLALNAARLSVRFFYQDNFGNILNHLKEHYDRMRIVRPSGDIREYMGVWCMLQETVDQKSKDKNPIPHMAAAVCRSILSGERYPASLYSALLGRIKAEQGKLKVTPGRASIVKAFIIENYKEEVTVELNENNQNVAYVLGREFAVLEAIQESANPGIKATIRDRYFNSACTTPGMVFPILFRLKNSHIRKISNKGQAVNYEKQLGSLQAKLSVADGQKYAFPKRLNLEDQGMFILGYYHQRQKRFEKTSEEE